MLSSRRRFLAVLGMAGGTKLAGCTAVSPGLDEPASETATETKTATAAGPHSWPTFQHDRRNSGHAATTGPTPPVTEQWPPLDQHDRPSSTSSPVVVEDTVYLTTSARVYALRAADSEFRWTFSRDPWFRNPPLHSGTPAVADDTVYVTVYVGQQQSTALYALAAADGTEQWNTETPVGSPTVADGTVYIAGGSVHAVSAADGTEQWSTDIGGVAESPPAVADDTVYVGSTDGTVYALSTGDGSEQWRYRTDGAVRSAPTVVEDTVYVGTGKVYGSDETKETSPAKHNVVALAAADGSERWTFETDDEVVASPAVADSTVYVGSYDTQVYALAAADGTEQWRRELNGPVEFGAPAVVDDTVYVGSLPPRDKGDNVLYALAAADGSEQWTFTDTRFWIVSPAVVDGTVYLGPMALE